MLRNSILAVNLKMFDEGSDGEGQSSEAVAYGIELKADSDPTTSDAQEGETNDPTSDGEEPTEEPPLLDSFEFDFGKLSPLGKKSAYTMFKEQFKDDFQSDFQHHFDRRFKDYKETQAKVSQYQPLVESLMEFYGAKDFDELMGVVQDDVVAEAASKAGFPDSKTYLEYKKALADGERGRKIQNDITNEHETNTTVEGWIAESLELQKTFPEFELTKALDNPSFTEKLQKGLSIKDAFKLVYEDSFRAERQRKEAEAKAKAREARPKENGNKPQGGIQRKIDPTKLSDADFEEIRRQVMREGKKISFG